MRNANARAVATGRSPPRRAPPGAASFIARNIRLLAVAAVAAVTTGFASVSAVAQPQVSAVQITSSPADSSAGYVTGSYIGVRVTFTSSIHYGYDAGPLRDTMGLVLSIGGVERTIHVTRASADGVYSRTFDFPYLVTDDDVDPEGVSVVRLQRVGQGLRWRRAGRTTYSVMPSSSYSLGAHAITNASGHKVRTAAFGLTSLGVTGVGLSPGFDPSVTSYEAQVCSDSVVVTATSPWTITGAGATPLTLGVNTIPVVVRSSSAEKTYRLRLNRIAPALGPAGVTNDRGLLTLSWANPDHGDILRYEWRRRDVAGTTPFTPWTVVPGSDADTTSFHFFAGAASATYMVEVRAVYVGDVKGPTSYGTGDYQSSQATITAVEPSGLTGATEGNLAGAKLTVGLTGSLTFSRYQAGDFDLVTRIPGLTISGVENSSGSAKLTLSYDGTDFDDAQYLAVRVRAAAHSGTANHVTQSIDVAAVDEPAPAAPSGLSAVVGDTFVILSWTSPGDGTITGYELRRRDGGGAWSDWAAIAGSDKDTVGHRAASLTTGVRYTFELRAVNAKGRDGGKGAASQVAATATASRDVDLDDDGLIEVSSLAQLDAIRWDLNGDGAPDAGISQAQQISYITAFGGTPGTICPDTTPDADATPDPGPCLGYELDADLDFDTNDNGRTWTENGGVVTGDSGDAYYNGGSGWDPIGPFTAPTDTTHFNAVFNGNGKTISNLFVRRGRNYSGLFAALGSGAKVTSVGLPNGRVRGAYGTVGMLAGWSAGRIAASWSTGSVQGINGVGGLVGSAQAGSTIVASYSTASAECTGTGQYRDAGGLAANNAGTIAASYAAGAVTGACPIGNKHGLAGGGTVTASYWDAAASGIADDADTTPPEGRSTSALQTPTAYGATGLYSTWDDVDVDGDGVAGEAEDDDAWDFGASNEYPVLKYAGFDRAVQSLGHPDAAPSFSGAVGDKSYSRGSPIAAFQVPAATGGNGAVTYAADGLPTGLSFDADGAGVCMAARTVCGAPTATGVFNVAIHAADSDANVNNTDRASLTFRITVSAPATVTASPSPLTETNLNGATLTVTLPSGVTFSRFQAGDFELVGTFPGLGVSGVADSSGSAKLTLSHDGSDFDADRSFTVRVKPTAHSGSLSHSTAAVPVTAVDEPAPAAPSGLAAAAGDGLVDLSWSDPGDGTITGYELRWRRGGAAWNSWAAIANSDKDTVGHRAPSLANGSGYAFELRAVNAKGRNGGKGAASRVAAWPNTPRDHDSDDDGLIEVASLAQLNAVRWDLNGDGAPDSLDHADAWHLAFPHPAPSAAGAGCPLTDADGDPSTPKVPVCVGYELDADLDFDTGTSGDRTDDLYWNAGAGWLPIGRHGAGTADYSPFTATFKGNGRTLSNLHIVATQSFGGLFAQLAGGGRIADVGLVGVDVRFGAHFTGGSLVGVVGRNLGGGAADRDAEVSASYAVGRISGAGNMGGLVGLHFGVVKSSYAGVVVNGNTGREGSNLGFGGLVGVSQGGEVRASYALGGTNQSSPNANYGGLVGASFVFAGKSPVVEHSYWDTETTGTTSPGRFPSGFTPLPVGKTGSALKSPTEYGSSTTNPPSIYAAWDEVDDVWDFGTSAQYPVLNHDRDDANDADVTAQFNLQKASLSALALSGLSSPLSPAFSAAATSYAAAVSSSTARTTVTATAAQSGARVSVAPADADADAVGHQVELNGGVTTVTVKVTAPNGAASRTYTVAVTRPTAVSIDSPSVVEGDTGTADLDFTVTLSPASEQEVTVSYADAGTGTATGGGTDYAAVSAGTLTFAVGETSKTVRVLVTGDATDEPHETVKVELSGPVNAAIGTGTGTGTIVDDDVAPSLSIDSPSVTEGYSGSRNLTFKVTLSAESGKEVTVDWAEGTGGTAASGTDYTAVTGGTLTFAVGTTSQTFDVSVIGDATDEPDETVVVTLSSAANATISTATGTGTITDDDGAPSLSIDSPSVNEGDSGAANLDFTVTLAPASGKQVTVNYAEAVGRTATPGTDYTALVSGALTFAAGETSRTVRVSVTGDATDEPDETVVVTLSGAANATISTATGTGMIIDDDGAPSLSINSPSVNEGDSGSANLDFTVTLAPASAQQVTVDYAEAAGTAASGTDYTALVSGTLTFAAGETSRTVRVSVTGDATDEPDETVVVTLSGAANATISTATGTGTITDDDGVPSLSIDSPSVNEGDSGAAHLDFTVTLSAVSGREVTVDYADAGTGTATSGTDYAAVSAGTLTFAVGETSKTVRVSVKGDGTDELDETVRLALSGAANAAVGTGTIVDDDGAPTVSIDSPSVAEGDSGSANLDFTVTLSAVSGKRVTVGYAEATGGTATSGTDYTALTSGTLTFAAGDVSKTITVSVTGDAADEADETVKVALSSPTNATVSATSGTGTGTITDDDGAPSLSINSPSVNEGDSGSANLVFTVTLAPASGREVTVGYADTGTGTATSGTDYAALTSGTLTFAAGDVSKTITVSVTGDATDEADETVRLALSDLTNAAVGTGTGTGMIIDDDGASSLSINSPSVNEGDSGSANLVFTVTLAPASAQQVTVSYAEGSGGTATLVTDYEALGAGTLTFAVGETLKTVRVSVTGDATDEPDETVVVTLSGAANATISTATGTGMIIDDDGAPSLSIDSPSVTEGDNLTDTTYIWAAPSGTVITGDFDGDGKDDIGIKENSGTWRIRYATNTRGQFGNETTYTWPTGAGTIITGDFDGDGKDDIGVKDNSGNWYIRYATSTRGQFGNQTNHRWPAAPGAPVVTGDFDSDGKDDIGVKETATNNWFFRYATSTRGQFGGETSTSWAINAGTVLSGDFNGDGRDDIGVKESASDNWLFRYATSTRGQFEAQTSASWAINAGTVLTGDFDGNGTDDIGVKETATDNWRIRYRDGAGNSGVPELDFTVDLSAASEKEVTVSYADAGTGTATSGTDYVALASGTLTFAAGDVSKTVRVSVTGDTTDEQDETVKVALSGPTNAALGTGTIIDDDTSPSLSVNSPSVIEGAAGDTASLTFTVTLSAASDREVTVDWAEGPGGTATSGTDYTAITGGTLTFAAGTTSQAFDVSVTGDGTDETDETVVATLSNAANATLGTGTGTGTITDDDASPTLSIDSPSVIEGAAGDTASLTFTVTLSAASGKEVTVDWAEGPGGTATSGTDYTAITGGTLTFAAGTTSQTFDVSVTGDGTDETDETVVATLSNAANATLGTATGTGTIIDDDGAPSLSIDSPSVNEGDSGSANLVFTVTLVPASVQQVTVAWAADGTDGGTATSGTDYAAVTGGTLTFAAGETSKTVTVSVTGDGTDEPNETVRLTLSGPTNAALGTATGTGTITDDDDAPSLSIDSPSVAEGAAGDTADLTFTATLSAASGKEVTVDYADAGTGTAISGTDYTAITGGTLTFAVGMTRQTFDVSVTGDALDEANETVVVTLSSAANATISTPTGTGTITDDDALPSLSIDSPSVTEGNDLTDTTYIWAAPSGTVITGDFDGDGKDDIGVKAGGSGSGLWRIRYATSTRGQFGSETTYAWPISAGTIITGDFDGDGKDDIGVKDNSGNWRIRYATSTRGQFGNETNYGWPPAPGVPVVTGDFDGDGKDDIGVKETATNNWFFRYATSTRGQFGGQASQTSISWAINAGTVLSGDFNGDGRDDIGVKESASDNWLFRYATSTRGNFQAQTSTSWAINAGTVFTGDFDGNGTDDIGVKETATNNWRIRYRDGAAGNSGPANLDFTVSLTPASGREVTVSYAEAAGGTATSGTDYVALASGTLTFAAGDVSKTVRVSVTGDTTDEQDETVKLALSGSTNAALGTGTGTGTIIDDDGAPTLSISSPSVAEGAAGDTANLDFTVTLAPASTQQVTVGYAGAAGGTATSGTDYTALTAGTLTFAAGETSKTVAVSVTGDATDEPDETVKVSLGSATNATVSASAGTGTGTITDDDAAPTVALAVGVGSVNESGAGNSTTVSASLSHASSAATTVTLTVPAGTTLSGTTLTVAAGATTSSGTVTITAVDNGRDEADRTVTVTGVAANGQGITQDSDGVELTITDDDDAPSLSIDSPSVAEGDSGTANLTFTVTLGAASGRQVTVDWAEGTGGTATSGTDYTAITGGTLTFTAGTTSRTFNVAALGDTLDESNETVVVTLSSPTNAAVSSTAGTGTGTITDDDATPSITLTVDEGSVGEGDGATTITVTAAVDGATRFGSATTVTVSVAGSGTASAVDFAAVGDFDIEIPAGAASRTGTFTLTPTADTADEADETVTVSGVSGSLTVNSATISLTDDDDAPTLSIASASVTEGDSGSANLTFTVTLSPASGREVTVDWAEGTGGTATSGTDYTAVTGGTLTFAAGDTSKSVAVSVTGDTLDESNETVVVTLSNAANAAISTASGTGTITDDDDAPTLSIASASVAEGDSGSATLTFTATLSKASTERVTVDYADAGTGTATSGTDYRAVTGGTLTFAAGATSQTFDVSVMGDTTEEPNETVVVTLSNATNATISTAAGTGTIVNDDGVTVSIDSPRVTEGDGGSATLTFTATLSKASAQRVTVDYADAGTGTATSETDYTAIAGGTLTFAAGTTSQTFDVSVMGDTTEEPNETVAVTLSDAANATIATATGTGTIVNDDGVTVSIDSPSVAEGDSGSKDLTFTVTLSPASAQEVTVDYADAGSGTATSGTDYTAVTGGTLTFAAGETSKSVAVSVTGDTLDESSETVVVTLSNAANATIATASGTGTITDNDATPTSITLTVDDNSVAEGDGATTITVTATVNGATRFGSATTVTVSVAGGGTASAVDFAAVGDFDIEIPAGAASRTGTFTLTPTADTADETDETVTVSGVSGSLTVNSATISLTDDDATPTLSINSPSVTEGDSGSANLTFTVTLSPASGRQVTVDWAEGTGGTATSGTDYTAVTGGTLTFAAGDTSKSVAVSVTGDTLDESNETVVVTLSSPTNAAVSSAAGTGTGTITDDDATPSITLTVDKGSVGEGDGATTITVTATVDGATRFGAATTVTVSVAGGGTATAVDFAAVTDFDITIGAGAASRTGTFTLTPTDDAADETDETITVSGTSGGLTVNSATITLTDDDGAPTSITLTVDDNRVGEGDGATTITVTATVDGTTRFAAATTVTVSVAGSGTATAVDFAAVPNFNIEIPAGAASATGTFTLTPTVDTTDETDETITVSGASGSLTVNSATITLTDDDGPTVSIDSPSVTEGDSGSTDLTFTATLSAASVQQVTVAWAEGTGGTATSGTDYTTITGGTLTFTAGTTSQTFNVAVTGDTTDELNETVVVTLGSPTNATIATGAGTGTITDDDGPTLSINSPSVTEGDSGSTNLTFTATLSAASVQPVTVAWAEGAGGTATSGTDYTAVTGGTLTFAAGTLSQTFTVAVTGDTTDEVDETVVVTLSSPTNATIATGAGTGTITDDDGPALSINSPSVTEGDSGSTNLTFTATLSAASVQPVTVAYADAGTGTATSGTDYTAITAGTLTFPAGTTSQTFTVAVTGDVLAESNETVVASLSSPTNATIATGAGTGTITDNDAAPTSITLTVDDNSVGEADGATLITVTATVDGATRFADATTVTVSVAGSGTATAVDFAAVSNFDIEIAAGAASGTGTFTLTPTDDAADETDETVTVSGTSGSLTVSSATISLTDDDGAPTSIALTVDDNSVGEADGATLITVTATVNGATRFADATTVTVSVAGSGTATAVDFAAVPDFNIEIPAGAASATGTFTLTPTDDAADETDETITVSGASGSLTVNSATISLTDDDGPTVSIDSPSVAEGDSGSTDLTFTATLSAASAQPVTVAWAEGAGGTATSGTDYTAITGGTLTFAAGDTSRTFTVAVTGDTTDEVDETVVVTLGSPTNATIATGTGTGTITDDDGPTVSIDSPSVAEGDSGSTTLTFTATLSATSVQQVTVDYADAGSGTATSGTDYTAITGGTLTFPAGTTSQTFNVAVTGDTTDELNETVVVTLSSPTNATISTANGTGTITDDDGPTVSIDSPSVAEGDSGSTNLTFTATLSAASVRQVTVGYTDAETGTATSGTDYTAITDGTLTFPAGTTSQTFNVAVTGDTTDEANETIVVTLGSPTNATIATGAGTGTITDDDGPTLSIDSPGVTEGDSGTKDLTFTVTLSAASVQQVTVAYADAGTGTATSGTDYTAITGGTLTFAAGTTSQTFDVAVTGDVRAESNETVVVTLGSPTNAAISTASGTGTITDNDAAPTSITLTVDDNSVGEADGATLITVTATVNGATRFADATTVTVSVAGGGTATAVDFAAVADFDITIAADAASGTGTFTLTPTVDATDETNETITVSGTSGGLTVNSATISLTDDDAAPTSITLTVDDNSVGEGDGATTITVTATVDGATRFAAATTVTVSVAGGGAAGAVDFAAVSDFDIEIAAGAASGTGTFTLTPTVDATDETNETITVSGASGSLTVNSATITLADDDGAPSSITLTVDDNSVGEADGATLITVTATVDGATRFADTTTVTVSVAGGGTATAVDFAAVSDFDIEIAAGAASGTGTFTLTPTDDAADETDETVTVSGTSGSLTVSSATIRLTDDDGAPSLSIASASVAEGDSGSANLTFTVTLSPASAQEVTVDYADAGSGTATSGTDYTAVTGGTLTFAAGETSKSVAVSVTGDVLDESNETVVVTLSNAANAAISTASGTGTITDDDATPSITLTVDESSVGEADGATTITVTATVNGATRFADATTVTVSVAGGGAATAVDFAAVSDFDIEIAAGAASGTGTFTLTPTDDAADETDETVTVSGTSGSLTVSSATISLTDDDGAPSLSIASASVAEGDSGSANLTFTVTLSPASAQEVTVDYADAGSGTATSGTDYTAVTGGTLTFAAGDTSRTFNVSVTGDVLDESNETVVVTLSNAANAAISTASGTGTITDDDATPSITLTVDDNSVGEADGATTITVTATVDGATRFAAATTVTVSVAGGGTATAVDFAAVSDFDIEIAAGAASGTGTFTLTPTDDAADETDETVTVSGASGSLTVNSATISLTDDDGAPSLSIDSPSVAEGDSGSKDLTFTVKLSPASSQEVTVDWAEGTGGTATSGTDYTAITGGTLTFAAGDTSRTFNVSVTGDVLDESNETVVVTLSNAANAAISTASGTGTITDDDATPSITLTVDDNSVGEADGATLITVTATVNGATRFADATTVTVSVAGGGAATAVDFAAVSDFDIEIAAGAASGTGTFTLTPTDDAADETDETVTVSGASGSLTVNSATISLTDDDGAPSLSIDSPSVAEGDSGSKDLTFTVTLSPASSREVTVDWADAGTGTATSGTDYTAVTGGTLTFAAGETSKSVAVSVTGDTLDESNETVVVALSGAANAAVSTASGTGTITDDDAAPSPAPAPAPPPPAPPPPPANVPPRVVGSLPDLDLDVGESAELRLAGVFADTGPLSHSVESSAPEVASARVEGNVALRVEGLSPGLATVTVTVADGGGLRAQLSLRASVGRMLSFAAPSASAPEGGAVRLPLTLSRPASAAMSVSWVARPDGDPDTADADAADLEVMSGTAAFAPGGTEAFIEVAVRDDGEIEPAREFLTVALAAPPEGADWALVGLAEATLAVEEGVCDRSPAVRDELRGPRACWAPTSSELAGRGYLGLHGKGIAALRPKDLLGLSGLRVLHLHRNRLAELPEGLLDGLGSLERLRLDGNRLASLPEGLFAGAAGLSELNLADNPGAPFPLVMRLVRTDAEPWAPGPARVEARVAEGAPFPLSAALLAAGAELSATQASVPAGAVAGPSVQATPTGPGAARLALAGALAAPAGVCGAAQDGRSPCFRGLAPQAGPPLLLFKPPPRPTEQPPAPPALSANGDRASLALDGLVAPAEAGGRLAYEARTDRPDLLTARVADGRLVLDGNEDGLEGTAAVTVTATDPDGLSASVTLTVTVEFAPAAALPQWRLEWMRTLRGASR